MIPSLLFLVFFIYAAIEVRQIVIPYIKRVSSNLVEAVGGQLLNHAAIGVSAIHNNWDLHKPGTNCSAKHTVIAEVDLGGSL